MAVSVSTLQTTERPNACGEEYSITGKTFSQYPTSQYRTQEHCDTTADIALATLSLHGL